MASLRINGISSRSAGGHGRLWINPVDGGSCPRINTLSLEAVFTHKRYIQGKLSTHKHSIYLPAIPCGTKAGWGLPVVKSLPICKSFSCSWQRLPVDSQKNGYPHQACPTRKPLDKGSRSKPIALTDGLGIWQQKANPVSRDSMQLLAAEGAIC